MNNLKCVTSRVATVREEGKKQRRVDTQKKKQINEVEEKYVSKFPVAVEKCEKVKLSLPEWGENGTL